MHACSKYKVAVSLNNTQCLQQKPRLHTALSKHTITLSLMAPENSTAAFKYRGYDYGQIVTIAPFVNEPN